MKFSNAIWSWFYVTSYKRGLKFTHSKTTMNFQITPISCCIEATETIKDCCQLFWYLIRIWNDRWYHKICLWKDGLASAKGHYISKSRGKKLKINFLRIWSLDFSSYTSYDFLIAKERTPHSQKSARISIDSKSIPDSVQSVATWNCNL